MNIRTEVRDMQKHIEGMAPLSKIAQIAIISKAQGMTKDEHSITVLALVKNRIIRNA
jgi:hypothetical protein